MLAREFFADKIFNMNAFSNFLGPLLGLGFEAKDLTFIQISLRAIIVFLATLIMVRLGHKRSLARKSAFDAILLVILASFLARAINGTSPLFGTIGAGFVIVLLNRLLALIAFYSHWFGILIKGRPEIIVAHRGSRVADDGEGSRQAALIREAVESGKKLTFGEIAVGSEDDDGAFRDAAFETQRVG